MKLALIIAAATLALAAPVASFAAMEHGSMKGMEHKAGVAHEEVVDGVKATLKVQTMADAMKEMGMEMPKGVKETHHVSAEFTDPKTGKALAEGEVKVKVQAPDKSEQTKDLMGMHGHFGADFVMDKKGKYGVMTKFKLKDGKVRSARFWYTVK